MLSSTVSPNSRKRKPRQFTTRFPRDLFEQFESKHPTHGEKSKILIALLQRYMDGQVHRLEYKESLT